jgi:N6-L-threonylcarbamoyladenine synthase
MKILGIETSCDDTCVSLIEKQNSCFKVLSNVVSSQNDIHKKWGGVYPTLAKREHQKNLPLVLKKALKKHDLKEIDLIAVAVGPGLDPCLWTGINFAQEISLVNQTPVVPVNHIEAHLLVSLYSLKNKMLTPRKNLFPSLGLIVSGGHTLLVLIKDIGKYKKLGETRDDAAGECFDKTARIIGLGYPGGPAIAQKACFDKSFEIKLPRPMINSQNYDFSFSGLKTAVLYQDKTSKKNQSAMAYEIQQAIIDVLVKKTIKAAREYKTKSIIIGGGVSANKALQKEFKKTKDLQILFPPLKAETDNALMIALTGYFKKPLKTIKAQPNLTI